VNSRRVLVTGAAGFVGANLTRRLLADGHDVHAIERPGGDGWRLDGLAVSRTAVDLRDQSGVAALIERTHPEWVFHLAAHGSYSWQTDRRGILDSNLHGTIELLEACLECGCEAFVQAGSSSEYGFKDHAPSEQEAAEPASDYAVAKASATLYAGYAGRRAGRRVVTLRLYSLFGPWEDRRRLVPTLIRHGLRGELPPLADPDVARDFVFVDDAVEAFVRAAVVERVEPGAVYNIGSGTQTTLREVVELTRSMFGIEAEPTWSSMPNRGWDTSTWIADATRAATELAWRPQVDLESGFRRTLDWVKGRGAGP
jgi:UDP-glucose 4-epimerase